MSHQKTGSCAELLVKKPRYDHEITSNEVSFIYQCTVRRCFNNITINRMQTLPSYTPETYSCFWSTNKYIWHLKVWKEMEELTNNGGNQIQNLRVASKVRCDMHLYTVLATLCSAILMNIWTSECCGIGLCLVCRGSVENSAHTVVINACHSLCVSGGSLE